MTLTPRLKSQGQVKPGCILFYLQICYLVCMTSSPRSVCGTCPYHLACPWRQSPPLSDSPVPCEPAGADAACLSLTSAASAPHGCLLWK